MTEPSTLDVIDLGAVEQMVYEAVVANQPIARDELAVVSGVVEPQLETAVQRLQVRGLINYAASGSTQLVASPPDIALGGLLLDREEQLKRARMEVEKLAEVHQRVASAFAYPSRLVEVVSGRQAVLNRFAQVQLASRNRIRIIDKPPYVSQDPQSNIALEQELSERGVRFQAIYDPRGLDGFHDVCGDVQASIEAGVEARVLPDAPLKLMLSDDRLAMIPLQTAAEQIDSIVIVHPSALLDALSLLFDQLWDRSLPLILPGSPASRQYSAEEPSDDDRRLLSLLTAGLPDEAIAKHLDISHRTMQRRLRVLLDRLGAQTRFQAALRAVTLGWLPAPPPGQQQAEPRANAVLSLRDRAPMVMESKAG